MEVIVLITAGVAYVITEADDFILRAIFALDQ